MLKNYACALFSFYFLFVFRLAFSHYGHCFWVLTWLSQMYRQLATHLIRKLAIPSKLIESRCVKGLGLVIIEIRNKMHKRRLFNSFCISFFMIGEPRKVMFVLGLESTVLVYFNIGLILRMQNVLSSFNVVSKLWRKNTNIYEACERIFFLSKGFFTWSPSF
jgi:hypothetical protein